MYRNKKVLILGFARSGYSVAKLLCNEGANVVVNDLRVEHDKEKVAELKDLGVEFIFGSHPSGLVEKGFDLLVKNPGVPLTHKYITEASNANVGVTTEVEVAYNCMSDATFIAITGTNGKTTTSTIIYEMLLKAGKETFLVGNIGNPISEYFDKYTKDTIFVVEVSSHQLYDFESFKADIALITNLSEAHLEFFNSKQLYYNTKLKIVNNMTEDDLVIMNADDKELLELTYNIMLPTKYFSTKSSEISGAYLDEDNLVYMKSKFDISDILLVGEHNYQNILSAIIAVKQFNVSDEVIKNVLNSFKGVEHRIEYVRSIDGVKYYNDSKSTNIKYCEVALHAFKNPTVLLLGGLERGHDFSKLIPSMNYVKAVVCYGETADRINEVMEKFYIDCHKTKDLTEAIKVANDLVIDGDIVLFSPACASWDQFRDYEERGDAFKFVVSSLQ